MLTITLLRKIDGGHWHSDTLETLPDNIAEDAILWVDSEDPPKEEIGQLKSHFGIGNVNFDELSEEGRRSRIEEIENQVFCYVSFPNRDHFISEVRSSWLALIAEKHWILSIHKGHSNITCEIYRKISSHGYSALSQIPSTDILLYIFLDLIANEFFVVSDLVHERLQHLSGEAASLFRARPRQSNRALGVEIAHSRDQVLALRQAVSPLREVAGRITRGEFDIVHSTTLPRFEDLYDRTISLLDVVDTHREEIHDIGDILINVQTLTTNNVVRVLTIISAIFLPLSLIAGIYGTNFGRGFFIPLSNDDFGFYAMVGLMIAIAAGLILVIKRKGWL